MELVKFDQAYQAIMIAKTVDEVKQIRDKAEALRAYLKQQGESLEMQNTCAEIRLRAERRAGQLLIEIPRSNGGRPLEHIDENMSNDWTSFSQILLENDVSRSTAYNWQAIATLPEPIFEQAIIETKNNCDELTSSRMLKIARRYIAKNNKTTPPPLTGKYRVLYADPPWKYSDSGLDDYGHAERHYPSMTIQELCDMGDDIKTISEDDAVLYLWVTSPLLESCFGVMRAWGFEYKASFIWDKVRHNHGHYNSVRHEFLLICTRGSCTPDIYKLFDSVQSIERTDEHSEKPEEFRDIIDTNYPNGNRIELFARRPANLDWEVWSNEPT